MDWNGQLANNHDEDPEDSETQSIPNVTQITSNDINDIRSTVDEKIPKSQLINNLLVMAIKWRRNTTYTIAQDILNLVNISCKTVSPKTSKYYWKVIIDRYSQNVSTHLICDVCYHYFGPESDLLINCRFCNSKIDKKLNNGSFLHLLLTDQLREIFETTDAHRLYSKYRKKQSKYAVEDIYDGKMYKQIMASDDLISINFNVDGAPIFESSNTSVYPVLCTVNELSPSEKKNHIMMSSIWFGNGKPKDMNAYLTPFVNEAKKLLKDGFSYTYKDITYKKRVVTLMGICDSVARPLVQCCTQFNGEYGCGLCLHRGESVEKGRRYARVYPVIDDNFFGEGLRTHEQTMIHAEEKIKKNKKGIKRKSILCDIPDYNIVKNLDVEWMHCVPLGVVRQFANLFFDSSNSHEKFYFGDKINEVDSYISSLSPTSDMSRTPRGMKDRVHMKAHEWVAFLLAYSLPILSMCLPTKHVKHWALLVDGISILTKKSIMPSEIIYADKCLKEFILGVESLYGENYMSFNLHLLAHLAPSVENWGPLFTHSAFIYEDFNQTIENSVKSANGVLIQICDSFRLKCVIDRLLNLCRNDMSDEQKKFLDSLRNKESKPESTLQLGSCKVLGRPVILTTLAPEHRRALQLLNVRLDSSTVIYRFKRCIINHEVITSRIYKREMKRVNFTVMLTNGQIFEIKYFIGLKCDDESNSYLIGNYYSLTKRPFIKNRRLDQLIAINAKVNTISAVRSDMVAQKVMIMKTTDENCVAYVHLCSSEFLT